MFSVFFLLLFLTLVPLFLHFYPTRFLYLWLHIIFHHFHTFSLFVFFSLHPTVLLSISPPPPPSHPLSFTSWLFSLLPFFLFHKVILSQNIPQHVPRIATSNTQFRVLEKFPSFKFLWSKMQTFKDTFQRLWTTSISNPGIKKAYFAK